MILQLRHAYEDVGVFVSVIQVVRRVQIPAARHFESRILLALPQRVGLLDVDVAHEVDEFGLDEMDKDIILAIIEKFGGGPVGLNTLSVAVNEDPGTIEEVYEPFLIQQGFINRTARGREATDLAYNRFNKKRGKAKDQETLFNQ